MDAVTHPHEEVVREVVRLFTPLRLNVLKQREEAKRFSAAWTPIDLVLRQSGEGLPSRFSQGWLAPASFVAELKLGRIFLALEERRYEEARRLSREVVASDADRERRGEARYWEAIAHYRGTGRIENLHEGLDLVRRDFSDTAAARKLSYPST